MSVAGQLLTFEQRLPAAEQTREGGEAVSPLDVHK
jgi:hypothetical protein